LDEPTVHDGNLVPSRQPDDITRCNRETISPLENRAKVADLKED
jgi:hypothetical protein